ncbi:DUF3800 domain-containing protein [Paraburkholderia xenovorans]|uniref:DUF3800 domain-containing protein n=1 Tax=Paraburkholderia xenovorans TaxID=36873 RepID=UPI0038B6DA6F
MPETAFAYLDESGDLGWKLEKPYMQGGASRYFVISIALGMNNQHRRIGKVVDELHKVQKWSSKKEKKWTTIGKEARENFCQLAAKELAENAEVKVFVAVYHKETAPDFLRTIDVRAVHPDASEPEIQALEAKYKGRAHLTYSMLVAETLAEHLPNLDSFTYCPDELNEGQRTLDHILTYRLLIQQNRQLTLNRVDRKQPMQRGLDFADMCAGAVFEAYQFGEKSYLEILRPYIVVKDFNSNTDATNSSAQLEVPEPIEAG